MSPNAITTLRALVRRYRRHDVRRLQQWLGPDTSIETAEAISRELFGMDLAAVLTARPASLRKDWRTDEGLRRRLVERWAAI